MTPQETQGPFSVPRKERRTYYLKLSDSFFKDKAIKKLRRRAGGNTYVIIVLELFLLSLEDENHLYYDGIEGTFAEEMALAIDERVEDVQVAIDFLTSYGWLVEEADGAFYLPKSAAMSGSISARTERRYRAKERAIADKMTAQCPQLSAECPPTVRECPQYKDKERAIDKAIDRDRCKKEKEESEPLSTICPDAFSEGKEKSSPSLSDVQQYASLNRFTDIPPEDFYGRFASQDWTDDGKDITDWRVLYLTLEGLARAEGGEDA